MCNYTEGQALGFMKEGITATVNSHGSTLDSVYDRISREFVIPRGAEYGLSLSEDNVVALRTVLKNRIHTCVPLYSELSFL